MGTIQMKKLCVLDTTISDYNLGNQIIMDSIDNVIHELFREYFVFKIQYAEPFGKQSLNYIKKSDYALFGGTNSLSSKMNRYKQMGFELSDIRYVQDLILLGVGWWQYQNKPNLYTKIILRGLLSSKYLHSVRDSYTKQQLAAINIGNVINTCCPTTWNLTREHCNFIPKEKAKSVVLTLTDYNKDYVQDRKLIQLLSNNYEKIYFWIQGIGDRKYIEELRVLSNNNFYLINPNLRDYDELLKEKDVDYIGTRLHAGIRALQHKKRTLIIAIDNRAKEISNDINLIIADRDKGLDNVEAFINDTVTTELNIPLENINRWKSQFLC